MKANCKTCFKIDMVLLLNSLLALVLNTYKIWENETANAYYTAAVTSMLQSWHNFFFASLDPAGFISIDKPPVVFWIQSAFASSFGVHGWSVILPQALAGVGSVLLIYFLVKPGFGRSAARLSSLIMACTPIAVAVSRTNNIDSMLVFALLAATWLLLRGIKQKKTYSIVLAFALVGLGFNMKMFQAYMVVPAFYIFYLLAFEAEWKRKLAVLTAATVVLISVTFSWAFIVDATPASERPYVGGSKSNSVLELATGYNGLNRLTGMGGRGGGGGPAPQGRPADFSEAQRRGEPAYESGVAALDSSPVSDLSRAGDDRISRPADLNRGANSGGAAVAAPGGPPPGNIQAGPPTDLEPDDSEGRGLTPSGGGGPQNPGGGSGAFGTGQAGPLRLFQKELSGQISWLLPLAALGAVLLLAGWRFKQAMTDGEKEALFWLSWLFPAAVFFSIAGFYHHYYLIMMAPPIAVLAGAGWVRMAAEFNSGAGWKSWLLPLGLLITTAFALYIIYPYRNQIGWGWLAGIGFAGICALILLFIVNNKIKAFKAAVALGMLVMLAGPACWAVCPLIYGNNNVMPQAGPAQKGRAPGGAQPGRAMQIQDDLLIKYIDSHSSGEKYFLLTSDTGTAENYIISTGKAVVAIGGFSGSDPALSVEKLEAMVQNREVKFFLIPSGTSGKGGGSNSEALNWIRANSTEVSRDLWQSGAAQIGDRGQREGSMALYQIKESSQEV